MPERTRPERPTRPVRLTREQSRAQTRDRLIATARRLFRRAGYGATSLDRIADEAGFSKGAVYSNFVGKEAIFLAALEAEGRETLDQLYQALETCADGVAAVEALATWADERSRSGNWALPILEYARSPATDVRSLQRQLRILRASWRELGAHLLARWPELGRGSDALTLGALLHELAYAPAISLVSRPRAGDLVRLALAPGAR